jgi:hypothetical protein
MKTRQCKGCGEHKPLFDFQQLKYNTRRFNCKACRVKEAVDARFKKTYGISYEEYEEKRKEVQYCCEICGKHEEDHSRGKLFVDHDHDTGKYRGLLCTQCNSALGMVYDNVEILQKMIEYLQKHGNT